MLRAVLPRSSGLALALLAVAGCGDRIPPPASLTSVTPASGPVDQSLTVQIEGAGFSVRVFTDFGDPNQSRTDDTYGVTIGGVALTGVQHISTTQLTGTLPAGVPQGDNDLQVTDPWGRPVTLAAAYFGIPAGGLPTDLSITAPDEVPIGACQAVTVEQLNAGGAPTVSQSVTTVALDPSPTGAFSVFSDIGCTTAAASVDIPAGQTSVIAYVRAADRATADLVASSTGLGSDSHTFEFGPTQIAFAGGAVSGLVGVCISTPLTIETQDSTGAASAVGSNTDITLSAPANLLLYDAPGCTTPVVTTITIPAGSSSASFYAKGISQGSPVVTASATGLGTDTRTVTVNPNTFFVFESVGPQGVATPFLVAIHADDGAGNVVTGFTNTATLTGQGGTTLNCVSNCGNGTATLAFIRGKWSGWVRANTAVSNATIHAAAGTVTGDSNAFNVLAPAGGVSAPAARLSATPGAVNGTGDVVALNASLSSNYGQGTLEFSFDPQGTTNNAPGNSPWTAWGPAATYNASGFSTGVVWQPRVAVRQVGDTVFSVATATVVSTSALLCTVTTSVMDDDGASSCTMGNKFGGDGAISLPEAIKLTNSGAGRAITADRAYRFIYLPGDDLYAVSNSTSISLPTGSQLIDVPLDITGSGVMVANVDITGTRPWTVSSGDLTLRDSVVHDHAGIFANGPLTLRRVLMLRCASGAACATSTGPAGLIRALFSEFVDAPGDALRIQPASPGGACPATAVDVQSSTFTRASIAINDDCTSGSRVWHSTFHANGTGIEYVGGSANDLRNNVFSGNTTATTCAAATFSNGKDYNLLFGNGTDGCVVGDANTLTGDPLYFIPEAGDFRIRSTSPAFDSATNLSLDVNDVGPGSFYGAGPDRGGRETP